MKTLCCLLFIASAARAQNPLTDAVMARYSSARQNLIGAAEAMPDDAYGFKPTPAQRPFSGWIGHVATANYGMCSTIAGEKAPDRAAIHEMTAKGDLVAAIHKSFDYCDAALKGMTDQKALANAAVVKAMIGLVASSNEHYGNMVSYLRLKGITPPSSNKK